VDGASIQALGSVATGIAVKTARTLPDVGDADRLRAVLMAAPEVHCPDTVRSTAGIHFARVLQQLGLADALAPRLRMHPNGTTAMRAVAASSEPGALGCTQITEILYTQGVRYAGDLPAGLELQTVYGAGVVGGSAAVGPAQVLVALLAGDAAARQRRDCGFVA
jgi:molybdate transport system substrate-binding protein